MSSKSIFEGFNHPSDFVMLKNCEYYVIFAIVDIDMNANKNKSRDIFLTLAAQLLKRKMTVEQSNVCFE